MLRYKTRCACFISLCSSMPATKSSCVTTLQQTPQGPTLKHSWSIGVKDFSHSPFFKTLKLMFGMQLHKNVSYSQNQDMQQLNCILSK